MLKVYILIVVIGLVGGIVYGAKYYYDSTQNRIAVLTENNAKLKTAVETSEASINKLQSDVAKSAKLNLKLQKDLQTAEKYGDSLRNKLQQLDLVKDALKDAKNLEGRMNGATAKIWREIMGITGGNGSNPIPDWLQQSKNYKRDTNGNKNRKNNNTDSSTTKTN